MSRTNIAVTLPSESTPSGAQQFVRVSGARGKYLHLFTIGHEEAAAEMVGANAYRAWFVSEPRRTVTVQGGTMQDVRRALHAFQYEPIQKKLVVIKPQCRALVAVKNAPVRWMITDKVAKQVNKQYAINGVTKKVHKQADIALPEDKETVTSIPKPIPAYAPISVLHETNRIINALTEIAYEEPGDWLVAAKAFRKRTNGAYHWKEVEDTVVLKNGKTGPKLMIARIKRPGRDYRLADLGLRRLVKGFVRECYPDLQERVEQEVSEEVPF